MWIWHASISDPRDGGLGVFDQRQVLRTNCAADDFVRGEVGGEAVTFFRRELAQAIQRYHVEKSSVRSGA